MSLSHTEHKDEEIYITCDQYLFSIVCESDTRYDNILLTREEIIELKQEIDKVILNTIYKTK